MPVSQFAVPSRPGVIVGLKRPSDSVVVFLPNDSRMEPRQSPRAAAVEIEDPQHLVWIGRVKARSPIRGHLEESSVNEVWRKTGAGKGDDVQRVRDASDIVRVVGEHVTLKAKGREYVCICPFHDDHSPSMCVVPAKQIFHCFVCGTGGDVFRFVRLFHKMDFREALVYLAERAGIELRPQAPQAFAADTGSSSRTELLSMAATAAGFFRALIKHPEHGEAARAVVARRGIRPDIADQFLIGAAADKWDGLLQFLKARNLNERTAFEAGLLKVRESGGAYDLFRNRLIFPIQDQIGRVVAFGGRRINDEDEPKYVNSPETLLFSKSGTLYALNHALKGIQLSRTVMVTEGYTDVIACHQGGFTNAVATLGTALTRQHATMLRRLCDTVVLLFDGDEAGERAADRAVEVFFTESLDVRICTLKRFTTAKDPDELLKREDGADVFRTALAGATDLLEYRFARLRSKVSGMGTAALSKAIEAELQRLVELGLGEVAPIRQRLIIRKIAHLAGVDEGTIQRSIPAGRRARSAAAGSAALSSDDEVEGPESIPALHGAKLSASDHLLGCLLCDGSLWLTLSAADRSLVAPNVYTSNLHRKIAQAVLDCTELGENPSLSVLLPHLEDGRPQDAAVALSERIERETEHGTEKGRIHSHFRQCLAMARQEISKLGQGNTSPTSTTTSEAKPTIVELIELKRREKAALGHDMRALPRPPS